MAVVGELLVLVGANNAGLMAGIAASEARLKGFSLTAGGLANAATLALVGIGIGAAVVAVKAIESASTFEDAMTLIQTQAGGSAAEVENMTTAILKLAPAVATGPQDLAAGLYHIESAGFRGAAALDILTIAAEGAKVGHAGLESTTNALVGVMNSGIGGFKGVGEAMGVTNAIIGAGNMRMEDLTGALSTGILPAARTFGVSFQSIGAAIATMTTNTVPAEEASTRLRMTLALLGAPSKKAVTDLASIGIGHLQLAEDMRGPGGMLSAVQDLKTHLDASGLSLTQQAALLSDAFGGGRSSAGIMTLLGSLDKFQTVQDQITNGTNAFGDAWAKTSQLPSTQWDRIGVSVDTIVKSLGLGLLPALDSVLTKVVPVATGFANWAADNPQTMSTILLVGGAVSGLGIALSLVNFLLGPVRLGMVALGLIGPPIVAGLSSVATAVGPASAAIGTAIDTGIAAGVGAGSIPIIGAAISAAVIAATALAVLPALTTPPVTDPKTGQYMYPNEDPMFGPHGPLNFLAKGYDSTFGTNYAGSPTPVPATAGALPWGAFNTPGFHAGEVGSPYYGPPTPQGRQIDRQTAVTVVNRIEIGGAKLLEFVETHLFNDASTFSSGFASDHGPTVR